MNVTQTVEVPADRRLIIDVPYEIPVGKVVITFTPAQKQESEASSGTLQMTEAQEIELINRNAERLNREALDVLSFQNLDL
jgi:hypothetical protein